MRVHLTEIVVQRLKNAGIYYDTTTPAFGIRVGKSHGSKRPPLIQSSEQASLMGKPSAAARNLRLDATAYIEFMKRMRQGLPLI
jgi:hypothetical protein